MISRPVEEAKQASNKAIRIEPCLCDHIRVFFLPCGAAIIFKFWFNCRATVNENYRNSLTKMAIEQIILSSAIESKR